MLEGPSLNIFREGQMQGGLDRLDVFVVLTAFSSFVLFLGIHILGFRYLKPKGVRRVLVYAITIGLLTDVMTSVWIAVVLVNPLGGYAGETIVVGAVASLLIYSMLVFNYMVWVFGMGEAAIRIRLLHELYRAPSNAETLEEIYHAYNAEMILKVRLSRLVDSGHLRFDGCRYSIGRRFLFIHAHFMRIIKTLMGIPAENV